MCDAIHRLLTVAYHVSFAVPRAAENAVRDREDTMKLTLRNLLHKLQRADIAKALAGLRIANSPAGPSRDWRRTEADGVRTKALSTSLMNMVSIYPSVRS